MDSRKNVLGEVNGVIVDQLKMDSIKLVIHIYSDVSFNKVFKQDIGGGNGDESKQHMLFRASINSPRT